MLNRLSVGITKYLLMPGVHVIKLVSAILLGLYTLVGLVIESRRKNIKDKQWFYNRGYERGAKLDKFFEDLADMAAENPALDMALVIIFVSTTLGIYYSIAKLIIWLFGKVMGV